MLAHALTVGMGAILAPLLWNLGGCWRAIVNDINIISLDPALQSKLEVMYAYPGECTSSSRITEVLLHEAVLFLFCPVLIRTPDTGYPHLVDVMQVT